MVRNLYHNQLRVLNIQLKLKLACARAAPSHPPARATYAGYSACPPASISPPPRYSHPHVIDPAVFATPILWRTHPLHDTCAQKAKEAIPLPHCQQQRIWLVTTNTHTHTYTHTLAHCHHLCGDGEGTSCRVYDATHHF